MSKRVFTIANVLLTLVFAYFAWLQHEDDNAEVYVNASVADVWEWIAFYGLVSISFAIAIFNIRPRLLYLGVIAFCLFELVVTGPGLYQNLFGAEEFKLMKNSMSPETPRVELSREFFGALIAMVAIGFLWFQSRRLNKLA